MSIIMDIDQEEPRPPVVEYAGIARSEGEPLGEGRPHLCDALELNFSGDLDLPRLQDEDLTVLDKAISLLNPPMAQLRVVEATTFTESEHCIMRGDVPLDQGDYSLSQKAIVLKRKVSPSRWPPGLAPLATAESEPSLHSTIFSAQASKSALDTAETGDGKAADLSGAAEEGKAGVTESGHPGATGKPDQGSAKPVEVPEDSKASVERSLEREEGPRVSEIAEEEVPWRELPEIIFFWARSRRMGGNLIVCPNESMDRLVQSYMVCEVAYHSTKKTGGYVSRNQGMLLGVEIGESLPAEQDALQNLLSNYSFQDASLGVVSLALSVWYFSGNKDDVNVLTLLAVGVVAGLNQEATWPWVFNLIIRCSQISDPMVRVAQCKRVHNHQGQQAGQGVLTIGLAVFGVYLEVRPNPESETPLLFRLLLNTFQGVFLLFLVMNMVQAVVPMALSRRRSLQDQLRPWAKKFIHEKAFDSTWYLSIIVALVWAGSIAAVAGTRDFGSDPYYRAWDIFLVIFVVLCASLVTMNPGFAILGLWGLIWLVPTGLAFVLRSGFDITDRVIKRLSLWLRRMARESLSHLGASFGVRGCQPARAVTLVFQVLPLVPLLVVFLPMPILYVFIWLLHLSLRLVLLLSDAIIMPVTKFRMYPLLSEYGSVTWLMSSLDMSVERSSMRTMLKRRISKLQETGKLGDLVRNGVVPPSPYSHLSQGPSPRLGCVAVMEDDEKCRFLKVDRSDTSASSMRAEGKRA